MLCWGQKKIKIKGYLCEGYLPYLTRLQEDANGIHSIRERYMNAASATPSTVFSTVLNLSNSHIEIG